MKTTIELPDELLTRAKKIAKKRKTSLKALFEHALRREVEPQLTSEELEKLPYTFDEYGCPIMKPKGTEKPVTSEDVYRLMEELGV